jgi:hypothetical protein
MHLLLDLDLSDPRLAFLRFKKLSRLELSACLRCRSARHPQYFELSNEGSRLIKSSGKEPPETSDEIYPLGERAVTLRKLRNDEYPTTEEAFFRLVDERAPHHQIGGHPLWLQDQESLDCPSCRKRMFFLGMVTSHYGFDYGGQSSSLILFGGGILYAFCCFACHITGTFAQST